MKKQIEGIVSARTEEVIVIEEMRESDGPGSTKFKYVQYWSKDGELIAEGPWNTWPLREG